MAAQFKIQVPKPCHEDWNAMTPNQQGRFCDSCAKSVVDFTKMKAPEIQQYFIENQSKKVCGRFDNNQLESIRIIIPTRVLYSQTQFHKMFLLALLLTMGTTLISCSDNNGDKQSIESVEVVENEAGYTTTMGASLYIDSTILKNTPVQQISPKKQKQFTPPTLMKGNVGVVAVNQQEYENDTTKTTSMTHIDTIQ